MDIKDIKEKKNQIESKIMQMLKEFSYNTGLKVKDIDITLMKNLGLRDIDYAVNLEVELWVMEIFSKFGVNADVSY